MPCLRPRKYPKSASTAGALDRTAILPSPRRHPGRDSGLSLYVIAQSVLYTRHHHLGGKGDRLNVDTEVAGGGVMSEVVDEDVNVLFIEDDPAVAEMYKLKLELDGYRVTVAKSGEEGLDQAKRHVPDIVFLDIRLPKMDGFAVLENLRADSVTRNIPVIILSNYGEKELVDRGLKLGALDYLIKSETTPASLSRGVQDWVKE